MIIKIVTDSGITYYEGEDISVNQRISYESIIDGKGSYSSSIIISDDYNREPKPNEPLPKMLTMVSWWLRDNPRSVITDFPCYIMNENGKTIDRV